MNLHLNDKFPKSFKLKIIIPEKIVFFDYVTSVTALSEIGEFMVLNDHESYLFHLLPSILICKLDTVKIVETKIVLDSKNPILSVENTTSSTGEYKKNYILLSEKAYLLDELIKEPSKIFSISDNSLKGQVIDLLKNSKDDDR